MQATKETEYDTHSALQLAHLIDASKGWNEEDIARVADSVDDTSAKTDILHRGYFALYESAPCFALSAAKDSLEIVRHFVLAPLFYFNDYLQSFNIEWDAIANDVQFLHYNNPLFWHSDRLLGTIDDCRDKYKLHERSVFCTYCDTLHFFNYNVQNAIAKKISKPSSVKTRPGVEEDHRGMFRTWTSTKHVALDGGDETEVQSTLELIRGCLSDAQIVKNDSNAKIRKEIATERSKIALGKELDRIEKHAKSASRVYSAMSAEGRSVEYLKECQACLEKVLDNEKNKKELADLKAQQEALKAQMIANEARIKALSQ